MPEEEELNLETMRVLATQAGLTLTDEELRAVMPGVVRNLGRSTALQKWVAPAVEPSTTTLVPRS